MTDDKVSDKLAKEIAEMSDEEVEESVKRRFIEPRYDDVYFQAVKSLDKPIEETRMNKFKVGDVVVTSGLADPVEEAWFVNDGTVGTVVKVDFIGSLPMYEVDFGQEPQYKCIISDVSEESLTLHEEYKKEKIKMPKFNVGDAVQFSEKLGDGIHDSVQIEAGTVGIIEERTIRDDGSFAYTIDFSQDGREFSVVANNIPESVLELF